MQTRSATTTVEVAVGVHDDYGKRLMAEAFGGRYDPLLGSEYTFGPGAGGARIDGTIDGVGAIDIESRTDKQVRGAILHPYPKEADGAHTSLDLFG